MAHIQPEPGPLLVFGGPYGNLQATRAVRAFAESQGIPASNVICTGDTAAYCAEPEGCISLLREWGIHVVQGNCEEALANDAEDCACGFEPGSACSLLSAQWYAFNRKALGGDSKRWMGELPKAITFEWAGLRFCCVHGSYASNNAFIFASSKQDLKQDELSASGADVILAGHCGLPFGQRIGAGYWLNAGVIGMPANDGRAETWVMTLTPVSGQVEVSWHRLAYDYASAQAAMEEQGLVNGYTMALANGLWPSMDVLPETERSMAGQHIKLTSMLLSR
ncbi:MAG: diadenosine tetraphosphatase [Oleiphilus sp.]|nr:MAG: diadenosine tetraphosphatase [Oleiphilus sp.]